MQSKWLENIKEINEELKPFYHRHNELFIENGCFMWGFKVTISKRIQINVLQELHSAHLGTVKMK